MCVEARRTILIRDVCTEIFLQICVLVIVDAHETVPGSLREVLHERCLTARRGTLQKNRVTTQ